MSQEKTALRAMYLSIAGNVVLSVVKGITGIVGNSYALVADAIESLSDVFSSLLVLLGIRYANRPADKNHPYGHGRAETLGTFVVVGFLTGSASLIAYQSIRYIRTPHDVPQPYTLVVLGLVIVVKEIFYRVMLKKAKAANSDAVKADAWHHRADAITSLAAFVGISIAVIKGKGYETADDWAALIASGVILYNAWLIFRPALGEIMDEHLHDDLVEEIRKVAAGVEGVMYTEKCHVRKAGTRFHVDLHAAVEGNISVTEGHRIAHLLKDRLLEKIPVLKDVLVHVEPAE